jgi:hypothetical protein
MWLFQADKGDGMGMPSLRGKIRKSGIPVPDSLTFIVPR